MRTIPGARTELRRMVRTLLWPTLCLTAAYSSIPNIQQVGRGLLRSLILPPSKDYFELTDHLATLYGFYEYSFCHRNEPLRPPLGPGNISYHEVHQKAKHKAMELTLEEQYDLQRALGEFD